MASQQRPSTRKFLTLAEIVKQRSEMVQRGPVSQRLKVDMDEERARQAAHHRSSNPNRRPADGSA